MALTAQLLQLAVLELAGKEGSQMFPKKGD
jgi:hypothetical protein